MKGCYNCKHCDPNWKSYSQLAVCMHPQAERHYKELHKGIWALYSLEAKGHCTEEMVHFEPLNFVKQGNGNDN